MDNSKFRITCNCIRSAKVSLFLSVLFVSWKEIRLSYRRTCVNYFEILFLFEDLQLFELLSFLLRAVLSHLVEHHIEFLGRKSSIRMRKLFNKLFNLFSEQRVEIIHRLLLSSDEYKDFSMELAELISLKINQTNFKQSNLDYRTYANSR